MTMLSSYTPVNHTFKNATVSVVFPPSREPLSCGTMLIDERQVTVSRGEFSRLLNRKFGSDSQSLKPLNEVFQIITEEANSFVRQSFRKKDGYLSRLFSKESWNEWVQDRTSLGRVVSLFLNHIQSSSSSSPQLGRLDFSVIKEASEEAANLLTQLRSKEKFEPFYTETQEMAQQE